MQSATPNKESRKWEIVAACLLGLAILLQFPGYGGTCTMGSTDALLVGSILSFVPSLAALAILIAATINASRESHPGVGAALIVVMVFAALMCVAATPMTFNTLVKFGSACGPGFDGPEYGNAFDDPQMAPGLMREDTLIGIIYGVMPLLCFVCAATLVWRRRFGRPTLGVS